MTAVEFSKLIERYKQAKDALQFMPSYTAHTQQIKKFIEEDIPTLLVEAAKSNELETV
jgi:hypothetical protein